MPPFLGSVQDMVDSAKSEQDAARLTTLVRQAAEQRADLFHYAAAVGDQAFFSIIMAFLPTPVFAREMRRRNANGRRPLECCEHMHPTLASALKTFFIKNGVDLDNNVNAKVSTAARAQVRRIVKLDEIVGMEKPRERILQAIRLSETTPDVPVKPVLLEGPPGTSCVSCRGGSLMLTIHSFHMQERVRASWRCASPPSWGSKSWRSRRTTC